MVSKAHAGAIAADQTSTQIYPIVEGNDVELHEYIVNFTTRKYGVYEGVWLLLSRLKHY